MLYFSTMDVFFGLKEKLSLKKATVLSIGNFDGVHRGHRQLISRVKEMAQKLSGVSSVMTFDPHPMKVLAPQRALKNIFPLSDRIETLSALGLDALFVEPFSRELSELSPEDFFKKLLVDRLMIKALYVGHDFSFGKNRTGTIEVLKSLCAKHSVLLEIKAPVMIQNEPVSSSKIREALQDGNVKKARLFLDRPFYLKGIIEKGAGRGKSIGIPTANLFTQSELFPKNGVYLTKTEIGKEKFISVTNVGQNPTFADAKNRQPIQVETHILNFNKDIYGEPIAVEFYDYIRTEVKFNSVSELVSQIKLDIKKAEAATWD